MNRLIEGSPHMVSMRNKKKKNYPAIIINTPSYLELCLLIKKQDKLSPYYHENLSSLRLLIMFFFFFFNQVMVFVHARNETVRTSTILRDTAKNNGDIKIFLPDQTVQYGDALKNVSFMPHVLILPVLCPSYMIVFT